MGEAKRKQYSRQEFLGEHPRCAYCGQPATTTDHCPPRSFFEARQWPEGYEFPACEECNQQSRLDEQVLAVLARIRLQDTSENAHNEWVKLLGGVARNQPEFLNEWRDVSPSKNKREFRKAFGQDGDRLRWNGSGMIKLGPLSKGAIRRFCFKLGQALYYRHIGEIFEGEISTKHIDPLIKNRDPDQLKAILELAPGFVRPERNSRSLEAQFIYRLNYSVELGALYAVVQFGPQMVFQIMALRNDTAQRVNDDLAERGITAPPGAVFHCELARSA
jgi:hypothetical protein